MERDIVASSSQSKRLHLTSSQQTMDVAGKEERKKKKKKMESREGKQTQPIRTLVLPR